MIAPVVILPSSAAAGIEARSKVERQALFHIAGVNLWARNGTVVRISATLGALILALAGARGRTLAYGAPIDAVWGDDPEGGPLDCVRLFNVHRSKAKDNLAALGVSVDIWWGCGYTLIVERVRCHGVPRRLPASGGSAQPHWAHRARYMAERGATNAAIAAAVGRCVQIVRDVLSGEYRPRQKSGACSIETADAKRAKGMRYRLRRMAKHEADETGEPIEMIVARWDCGRVDRSRLWDQRRTASTTSEASV